MSGYSAGQFQDKYKTIDICCRKPWKSHVIVKLNHSKLVVVGFLIDGRPHATLRRRDYLEG
jgi:hypothetical protein